MNKSTSNIFGYLDVESWEIRFRISTCRFIAHWLAASPKVLAWFISTQPQPHRSDPSGRRLWFNLQNNHNKTPNLPQHDSCSYWHSVASFRTSPWASPASRSLHDTNIGHPSASPHPLPSSNSIHVKHNTRPQPCCHESPVSQRRRGRHSPCSLLSDSTPHYKHEPDPRRPSDWQAPTVQPTS